MKAKSSEIHPANGGATTSGWIGGRIELFGFTTHLVQVVVWQSVDPLVDGLVGPIKVAQASTCLDVKSPEEELVRS